MLNYEGNPDYIDIALKPRWKSNLCLLFFVAVIVSASILLLITK